MKTVLEVAKDKIQLFDVKGKKEGNEFLVQVADGSYKPVAHLSTKTVIEETIDRAMESKDFTGRVEVEVTPTMAVNMFLEGTLTNGDFSHTEHQYGSDREDGVSGIWLQRMETFSRKGLSRFDIIIRESVDPPRIISVTNLSI